MSDTKTLLQIDIPGGHGTVAIEEKDAGKIIIHRIASRSNIHNLVENYDWIDRTGRGELRPLTEEIARRIVKRIEDGYPYASSFVIADEAPVPTLNMSKTAEEHKYTSSGIRFWRHQQQMESYRAGKGDTIVSTHISPEGACPLKCPYCSVTYRDTHSRIPLEVVRQYVIDLKSRGLKAIILTGGGEPTIWAHFNELVQWCKYDLGLSVALITNGVTATKIQEKTWKAFSWVRVSINVFDGWEEKIRIPHQLLDPECVVGCSMVYTSEHQATKEKINGRLDMLKRAAKVADAINCSYFRIQPNCLLDQKTLMLQHQALDHDLRDLNDERFFHQHKEHETPKAHVCHQAFFRPYLSEEKFEGNGQPGTIFPCDSLTLTDSYQHFAKEYQICHASNVLDWLDGKIKMKFDPTERCSGCVFAKSLNTLDAWKSTGADRFAEFPEPLRHEEFV